MDSILISIKKLLGIESDYTQFDTDIIMHINAALFVINQLGIGPEAGFVITGDTETWTNLIGEVKNIEAIKSLVYLKVRLLFDPPSNDFLIKSIERQIEQYEWRLNVQVEDPPVVI